MSPVLLPFLNVNLVLNNQGTPPWMLLSQLPPESSQQAPNTASRRSGPSRVKPTSKGTLSRASTMGTQTSRVTTRIVHTRVSSAPCDRQPLMSAAYILRRSPSNAPLGMPVLAISLSTVSPHRELTAESTLRTGQMPIVM
jgi:hypothetical protein